MGRYQTGQPGNQSPDRMESAGARCSLTSAVVIAGLSLSFVGPGCSTSAAGRKFFALRSTAPAKTLFQKETASGEASDSVINSKAERFKEVPATSPSIRLVNQTDESPVPAPASAGDMESSGSTVNSSASWVAPPTLTLAELESRAIQNNPTLSQAQAAVSGAQGLYVQAGLYPNPQLGYINSSASNPSLKQSNGAFFSQEFVTANKLGFAQQAASEELKRYQWDFEAQRLRVLNDLKIRYFEVLGAQEAVAVNRELLKVSEKSLEVAKSLLASEGTRTDYLQAKVQLETVRLNLEEAELRYNAAWEQLASMIGQTGMAPVPLEGALSADLEPLDQEACWQTLLSCSPQLRAAESELGHGWATYREQQAIAIPNITVQAVADYDNAIQASTVSTLVAFPLPIFNRNQGNIDKAAADIKADQDDLYRIQLVLRDQLSDSFRRYQTSLRQAQRLKESILPSAEENLTLCQQLFEKGQTAFAPVLAAQQSYFKSKVAYVEALTEVNKVVTEIEGLQLTGGLNPAAIGSAIQIQPGGGAQRQRALLNELQDNNSKQLLPAAQIGR